MKRQPPIRAVVFDAYGTLVEIKNKRSPYRQLFELSSSGTITKTDYARAVMTRFTGLDQAATLLGLTSIPELEMSALKRDLQTEIESIALYQDTPLALRALSRAEIHIGVCSNLAAPYAEPVVRLLPFKLDAYAWSFETGCMKPDRAIYHHVCRMLDLEPSSVLMVGDREDEDFRGPISAGLNAIRLRRGSRNPQGCSVRNLVDLVDALLER